MSDAADLVQRASAFRNAQQMEDAYETIAQAARQTPNDPRAAFGLAQISFETWRPAADLFAAARQLAPDTPDLIRNHALALVAEGAGDVAETLLEGVLAVNPGWIDGHKTLATLRLTAGDGDQFDDGYVIAARAEPANVALRMAWFQHYAIARNWDKASAIIADAQAAIGRSQSLDLAALFIASESGRGEADFAPFAKLRDPGTDLCHVRHLLRAGEPMQAEVIALRHVGTSSERIFWPYLSLCWRLLNDPRAPWLDGASSHCAQTFDLDCSKQEMAQLAGMLRGLHRLKSAYPEQSVRGGTQTDRQLFFHPDPAIQSVRAKIMASVAAYIAELPSCDASHPLLGPARDTSLLVEGSWSVRLKSSGFHSSHIHPKGWISSAFYIAIPDQAEMGQDRSGWLSLGAPPAELDLGLASYGEVEPKPGRLVLFPSSLWHSTRAFAAGERLTIAFDIKLPAH
jgi:tetratricopeptide (TPR) repeat protein